MTSVFVSASMYRMYRHEEGACFTCPRCGHDQEYVNTDNLGSFTTDCVCGSKIHHFLNDTGKPVFRLIPTKKDLKYMEAMPDKVKDQTYRLATYNREFWMSHVDDVAADY